MNGGQGLTFEAWTWRQESHNRGIDYASTREGGDFQVLRSFTPPTRKRTPQVKVGFDAGAIE